MHINTLKDLINFPFRFSEETFKNNAGDVLLKLYNALNNHVYVRYEFEQNAEQKQTNHMFAHLNGAKVKRIILTTKRNEANFSKEIFRYCNGLVIDYETWKVLCLPVQMCALRYKNNHIIAKLPKYKIYEMKDGTIINLYYYESSWRMSTTNAYEVNNNKQFGSTKTYYEALNEILKSYPDFVLDKLNINKTYTFGLKYKEFHPFLNKNELWGIQTSSIENQTITQVRTVKGLPKQRELCFADNNKKSLNRSNFYKLIDKNKNALNNYLTDYEVHYGYILRSDDGDFVSNIMIESTLMKKIRQLIYNHPKKLARATKFESDNQKQVDGGRIKSYMILRSYIGESKKLFLKLFPQYINYYEKYDELFNSLSKKITTALRNRNARKQLLQDGGNEKVNKTAYNLLCKLESQVKVNAIDPLGIEIVNDFLYDPLNIEIYLQALD